MNRQFYLVGVLLVLLLFQVAAVAGPADTLIFAQLDQGEKILYVYATGQPQPVRVASGKEIKVFLENRHFFYFVNRQLFEYDFTTHQSRLLNKFAESDLEIGVAAAANGLQQMLIAAKGNYEINYYILDLKDNSVRRLESPWGNGVPTGSNQLVAPDRQYMAVPKNSQFKGKVSLSVVRKASRKYQDYWTLPAGMTVLPELLSWSPNSKLLLFHAKKNTGYEGFYSLYCLNVETKKLQMLAETVLYYDWIGYAGIDEFLPDWSADSKFMVFQSQPTGSPAQSEIFRYEVKTGKVKSLANSAGQNQKPRISPTGEYIAFLSNREQGRKQLYLMDGQGGDLKRISTQGVTLWAKWFK